MGKDRRSRRGFKDAKVWLSKRRLTLLPGLLKAPHPPLKRPLSDAPLPSPRASRIAAQNSPRAH